MLTASQEDVVRAHKEIDFRARDGSVPFVSGWSTSHPVQYEHIARPKRTPELSEYMLAYSFISDDDLLKQKICRFHEIVDGVPISPNHVFLGAGSSPLVSSTMVTLAGMKRKEIHYIKPVYHAYYYLAGVLGVRMTGIGDTLHENYEQDLLDRLPEGNSVLLITDPSWISGRALSDAFWDALAAWQRVTESLVVVDGTFQYTKWNGMTAEAASRLDLERTIRLVCPTKSLCVHGLRFSYLILPQELREDLGWAYCKLVAATSTADISTAHLLMDQLASAQNNRALTAYICAQYRKLVTAGVVRDVMMPPDCTYYVFGRPAFDTRDMIVMRGWHFEIPGADEWIRINLLSAHLSALAGPTFTKTEHT
jgi:aspartate/methionine/tyrosine aminotransferase